VAGLALLPWEKWLVKLLHPLYVAIRRRISERERKRDLVRSTLWPRVEGTVHQIKWDSSLPREGLQYAYDSGKGYYSGLFWRWFERDKARQIKVGDRVLLGYNPENPDDSVLVEFQETESTVKAPSSVGRGF
jgi:hypothetical protein